MEETDVNPTEVDNVEQGRYHNSPNTNNQTHNDVHHKQQVGQEEEALSEIYQIIYLLF